MYNDVSNCKGNFLSFRNGDIDCTITNEEDQQITCDFNNNELRNQFTINFVYSQYKGPLRMPLLDKMLQHAAGINKPSYSMRDYNVIATID